jgi:PTS system nitrogen regulatory IIA component
MTNKDKKLHFDSIMMDVHANSMKQAYQILADQVSQLIGTPKQSIISHLIEAEKNQTAIIGNGIAIPHMRLERLTKPMVVFMKLNNGIDAIDMDNVDDIPADLFCLVLSPDYEGTKHLQRLSMVSRAFKNNGFCKLLRQANNKQEIRSAVEIVNEKRIAA